MRKFLKFLKWTGIAILSILLILYIVIELRQNRIFDAPYPVVRATDDSLVIARGKALVYGPAHCANCHAPKEMEEQVNKGIETPLSGGLVFDLPIGEIYAKNITPDATGIGNMTDAEVARALRYGVRKDGRALFDFMPFHNTSDEDLTAIISYLRSQPAVKHEVPENKMNLVGKAVSAFLLKPAGPVGDVPVAVKRDTSALYGQYLANNVANCRGCHTNRDLMTGAFIGEDYAGGLQFETATDSGTYYLTTPNLTPDEATGRIVGWSQRQFIDRFRTGRLIKQTHMPWGPFGRMSDDELKAIYNFLQTVKPVRNEVKLGLMKK
ncbi:MAG: c-type cytochrome [Chitinophagaceae bacterium]|nr:c-type cytochrome [Chitinophagaceae bacterium]